MMLPSLQGIHALHPPSPTAGDGGAGSLEDDLSLLSKGKLDPPNRAAAQLRLGEKRIVQATLDAVRA